MLDNAKISCAARKFPPIVLRPADLYKIAGRQDILIGDSPAESV